MDDVGLRIWFGADEDICRPLNVERNRHPERSRRMTTLTASRVLLMKKPRDVCRPQIEENS